MKFLLDFLPLAFFFGVFKVAEADPAWAVQMANHYLGFMAAGEAIGPVEAPVLLATAAVMLATLAQVLVLKLSGQKVELMVWISLALVVVLGLATVYFRSELFIKWKPTVLYALMAVALWASLRFWGKNALKHLLKDLPLPDPVWRRLNALWIGFFCVMGVLNLVVAYQFSTATWASFKVFGTTGLMLLFVLGQGVYLSRHLPQDGQGATE